MPLPFLTADREFGVSAAADVPLPFEDRDSWRRPYRPGPWRVSAAAVLLLLASYLLMAGLVTGLAGSGSGALTCVGIAAVVVVVALRMLRVGAWVSARGVRRVSFLRTRTLAWSAVSGVRRVQQPVRWMGLPRTVQGQAVVASVGGEDVVLATDHDGDFLGREAAFRWAAERLARWGSEYAQR
ncbi:hypothetical protein [Streptomyces sp. NPDC060194]|uniref:hypothetical protein n=1 Tax=Streptomyces sp. NPDC060194 TaxID=3347069 RepID=UPI0036575DB4